MLQEPTIPQKVWFTISLPCFHRAWLCKWNWWRPQPWLTESPEITVDLQHLQCHPVTLVSSHGAPGRDSLMLRLSSIGSHCPPPKFFLLWAQLCHPRAHTPGSLIRIWWLLVGARQSWLGKLTHGIANKLLWGEKEGMGKGRKEKVYSESCWWNFSQLITHKTDSLLTLLCSLIFHIILFTGPSACSTKVKWREW